MPSLSADVTAALRSLLWEEHARLSDDVFWLAQTLDDVCEQHYELRRPQKSERGPSKQELLRLSARLERRLSRALPEAAGRPAEPRLTPLPPREKKKKRGAGRGRRQRALEKL